MLLFNCRFVAVVVVVSLKKEKSPCLGIPMQNNNLKTFKKKKRKKKKKTNKQKKKNKKNEAAQFIMALSSLITAKPRSYTFLFILALFEFY